MTTMTMRTKNYLSIAASTVVDIPAESAFDVLADFSCHPQVFRMCTRMERLSSPDVGNSSAKEGALTRPIPGNTFASDAHSAIRNKTRAPKEVNIRQRTDQLLVGSKYQADFVLADKRSYSSVSTLTRVDVDSESNRYEISWAATLGSCTLTTTQIVHEVQPGQKQQQQQQRLQSECTTNESGSCHITFSCALAPNNWRGRVFFWFRAKQLQMDGMRNFLSDVEDICAEVRKRMDASKEGHLNTTIGKVSTASTHLTEETDAGS